MDYRINFYEGYIDVYLYMVWKDIQTHVSLFGIPDCLKHLREEDLPKIVNWVQSRNGFQTYYHCFTMIILYCQNLLCSFFDEMKQLISKMCE